VQQLLNDIVAQIQLGTSLSLPSCATSSEYAPFPHPTSNVEQPPYRKQIPSEHQTQELAAFIMPHADPVLQSHLEDLNYGAVPIMKKHDDAPGWRDVFMGVRMGTLTYGDTYEIVKNVADSSDDHRIGGHCILLAGCIVAKCPAETDKTHFAFVLKTSQVHA
jgi:hypothetical protein